MRLLFTALACLITFNFSGQSCNYGSSTDASEICDFIRGNNFSTYKNADIALDRILDVTGMSKRFVLKECSNISNCMATTYKGIRYILYDKEFMDAISERTNSWSSLSILAHEIGHHVNGHTLGETLSLSESRQMELEADEYSGFVMQRLGASLTQAQDAINTLVSSNRVDTYSTHPSRDKRLRAIEIGYNKAKSQTSNNDNSTTTLDLTAEDYFYKAYNNESDWQYQIDNYTKCLRIDPDYFFAYYNRGLVYGKSGNYEDCIADCTRAIRIDPDYVDAYNNRGIAYDELGNYEDAIADYTRAIRIDPDYANAYNNRGFVYKELGNYEDAIADYTRAIRIDPDYDRAYYNRGLAYNILKHYEDAIADYTRAIRIDPDYASAYYGRGTAKWYLKLEYCPDYKRACDLGLCKHYNTYCK